MITIDQLLESVDLVNELKGAKNEYFNLEKTNR